MPSPREVAWWPGGQGAVGALFTAVSLSALLLAWLLFNHRPKVVEPVDTAPLPSTAPPAPSASQSPPGDLGPCCTALGHASATGEGASRVYLQAAANYCQAVRASVRTSAQDAAARASLGGMLRGNPLPAECR